MSGYVFRAEVVKVDKDTLKYTKYPLFMPMGRSEEDVLRFATKACNVGDFLILPSGKKFRRIRGGFRETTEEDMAELVTSQL